MRAAAVLAGPLPAIMESREPSPDAPFARRFCRRLGTGLVVGRVAAARAVRLAYPLLYWASWGNSGRVKMSATARMMKTGPFCSRCGPTDRDPIVSNRCKRCGAPIRAPLRSQIRGYRKEALLFVLFALGIVAILSLLDFT